MRIELFPLYVPRVIQKVHLSVLGYVIYLYIFVFMCFTENQIDGESFLDLTEGDIKEVVKPLGVVKKIVRIQKEVNYTPFTLSWPT